MENTLYENLSNIKFKYIVDKNWDGTREDSGTKYFYKISEALEYTQDTEIASEVKIFIRDGDYYEKLRITRENVVLIGESRDKTRIYYDDYAGKPDGQGGIIGTFRTATVTSTEGAAGFTLINLTIENIYQTPRESDSNVQAVALKNNADCSIVYNVNLIGYQDTLYAERGRQYYSQCTIQGDVDFIFGGGNILIEECIIKSVERYTKPKGYIVAPRTNDNLQETPEKFSEIGFVIKNCQLISNIENPETLPEDEKVYLGRPWRQHARAVFLNNYLGLHISKNRWSYMNGGGRRNEPWEAYFREYGSYGPGSYIDEENAKYLLEEKEVSKYTIENIFSHIPMFQKKFNPIENLQKVLRG